MATFPPSPQLLRSTSRSRRLSRIASVSSNQPSYIDIVAIDDGSVCTVAQSSGIFHRWVPESEWSPGFRWLKERITEDMPYARIHVYQPNDPKLSTNSSLTTNKLRYSFFLAQFAARRTGEPTWPVIFIAFGRRAGFVRNMIKNNEASPQSHRAFYGNKPGVLLVGARTNDSRPQRIKSQDPHYEDLLMALKELPEWKPMLRAQIDSGSHDRLQQIFTPMEAKEYSSVLTALKLLVVEFLPALLIIGAQDNDGALVQWALKNNLGSGTTTAFTDTSSLLSYARDGNGSTPLIIASTNGYLGIVEEVLKASAKTEDCNLYGLTALQAAAASGKSGVLSLLLRSEANVNAGDTFGRTALIQAACFNHSNLLSPLIRAGADVRAYDLDGNSALHVAAEAGFESTAKVLVHEDIKIDDANLKGRTALITAASKGDARIVRLLLENGADFTQADNEGKAAFSLATSESVLGVLRGASLRNICARPVLTNQDFDAIEGLLAQGADIDQKDDKGNSALSCAIAKENERLQNLLENPPLSNGPSSYKSGRSFGVLKWPSSLNPKSDSEVHCEVVDFHLVDGKEKRFRAKTPPTVFDLLYNDNFHTMDQMMSNQSVKGSDAVFRWIHLPACNLNWVKDAIIRINMERYPDGVDAHHLDEMISKLMTSNDWRRRAISQLPTQKRLPHLKPQATFVRRLPHGKELTGDNSFLFMPYLHYESHARFKEMAEIYDEVRPAKHIVERLLQFYSRQEYPLHPRRTLDQFFYSPLDTKKRDSDQVVYRYMRDELKTKELQLFMVDQLWIWILDGGRTVLSSFPRQWKIRDEDRDNPLHDVQKTDVLSSILRKLESPDRQDICSPYELAVLICNHCFGTFFDPSRALGEDLHFIQFFQRSIGKVSDAETKRFQQLKRFLKETNTIISFFQTLEELSLPEKHHYIQEELENIQTKVTGQTFSSLWEILNTDDPRKADEITRRKYEQFFEKRSHDLLDISEEIKLMHEIKDIRDELSIINLVFDDQILAIESMLDLIESGNLATGRNPIKPSTPRFRTPSGRGLRSDRAGLRSAVADTTIASASTMTYSFPTLLQVVQRHREIILKMDKRAHRVHEDIEHLLDLKQKQASVIEAHFSGRLEQKQRELLDEARQQTEKAGKQGNTVMVFTVVATIFLPASFMASILALQVQQYPHSSKGELVMTLDYVVGCVIGVTAICIVVISAIGFNIDTLRDAVVQSRMLRWIRRFKPPEWLFSTYIFLSGLIKLPFSLLQSIWVKFKRHRATNIESAEGVDDGEEVGRNFTNTKSSDQSDHS